MTLRQLEAFLAVARAKSFRRAADGIHLSQPALSQHIRQLEEEFGVRLFDRLGRSVALTEAGRLLEEDVLRLFGTLSDARARIAETLGLKRGRLVVGASTTPGVYVLPRLVAAFRARYPGIELSLRIANSRLIEERVRANELDLGVIGGHLLGPREECVAAGLHDELLLVVPPTHRWAKRRVLEPERLHEEPLLMREEGSATRALTERSLRQHGVRFRVLMELSHTEAIKQAVMTGLGVAFLSVHAIQVEAAAGRLHALRLHGLHIRRHFHVIHHPARTLPPAGRAFLALVQEQPTAGGGRPGGAPRAAAQVGAEPARARLSPVPPPRPRPVVSGRDVGAPSRGRRRR